MVTHARIREIETLLRSSPNTAQLFLWAYSKLSTNLHVDEHVHLFVIISVKLDLSLCVDIVRGQVVQNRMEIGKLKVWFYFF